MRVENTTYSRFCILTCFTLTARASHHAPRLAPTVICAEMTDILRSTNKWSLIGGGRHPVWAGALQYFPLKGLSIWFIMVESVRTRVRSLSLSHKLKCEYGEDRVMWILMCTSTVTLCIQMCAKSLGVHGHAFPLPVILNCCYEQQVHWYFPWVGVIMKHLPRVLCHQRGQRLLLMNSLLKWKIALIMFWNRFPITSQWEARWSAAVCPTALFICTLTLTHFTPDHSAISCRLETLRAHWLNGKLTECIVSFQQATHVKTALSNSGSRVMWHS